MTLRPPPLLEIAPAVADDDWLRVRTIRHAVFVEEQACPPELEWDAPDAAAHRGTRTHHLLARVRGEAAGCARWRAIDGEAPVSTERVAKLERFAVLPAYRGTGVGRALVNRAMADATAAGFSRLVLHAQAHLAPWYASFGFRVVGVPFDEAGIRHVKMERTGGAA